MPGAASAAAPAPAISAAAALVAAMQSVGIVIAPGDVTATPQGPALSDKTELRVAGEQIAGPATSQLVYFPLAPGVLVLAYQQTTFTDGPGDWLTLVDASNGTLLWRKNIRSYASTQEARFSVYVQADGTTPADSPAPQSPTTAVPGAQHAVPRDRPHHRQHVRRAGPRRQSRRLDSRRRADDDDAATTSMRAWIASGGAEREHLRHRHARHQRPADRQPRRRDAQSRLPRQRRPRLQLPARRRRAAIPRPATRRPAPALPQDAFRRGAVTQLFYVTNWYHDQLFKLGFDEAAGNFQNTNFSGMGLGGDRVLADAQDASGTNNANFATPPDGQSGRMQMFRFTGPTIDRDGDLDAEIVIHELTHGLSNRLVGNAAGLIWSVGGGHGRRLERLLRAVAAEQHQRRRSQRAVRVRRLRHLQARRRSLRTTTSTASAASRTPPTTRSTR